MKLRQAIKLARVAYLELAAVRELIYATAMPIPPARRAALWRIRRQAARRREHTRTLTLREALRIIHHLPGEPRWPKKFPRRMTRLLTPLQIEKIERELRLLTGGAPENLID